MSRDWSDYERRLQIPAVSAGVDRETVAERIARALREKELSLREFQRRMNCENKTVENLLTGQRVARMTLLRAAQALEIDGAELIACADGQLKRKRVVGNVGTSPTTPTISPVMLEIARRVPVEERLENLERLVSHLCEELGVKP